MHALSTAYRPFAACAAQSAAHGCSYFSDGVSTSPLGLVRPFPLRRALPAAAHKQSNPVGSDFLHSPRRFRVHAGDASALKAGKWLLRPIGDGDCSHLDEAVPLPGAIEFAAESATVGRVRERADIVIPVATVSGLHARLERKGETLFITDLDSTNGTYINDRQLRPGSVTPVPPGSRVTFGDDHLAAFKFCREEEAAA